MERRTILFKAWDRCLTQDHVTFSEFVDEVDWQTFVMRSANHSCTGKGARLPIHLVLRCTYFSEVC